MTHDHLKTFIDSAYEHAAEITPETKGVVRDAVEDCLLYTSPSPRDRS